MAVFFFVRGASAIDTICAPKQQASHRLVEIPCLVDTLFRFQWCNDPPAPAVLFVSSRLQSLERIFPNGLDMALIVDDRDDVWRGEQAKNLLLVRPYKFFVVSERLLGWVGGGGHSRLR